MSYGVIFVGLVCFYKEPDGSRSALFPDGRAPSGGIDPHHPFLMVEEKAIINDAGLPHDEGRFEIPNCRIELPTAIQPGELDVTKHDPRLTSLQAFDPSFEIDPATAGASVLVPIRRGRLEAFRYPGSVSTEPNVAIVSRLEVDHTGPIPIRIFPFIGGQLTVELEESTEIVIGNTAARSPRLTPNHFPLYGRLAKRPVNLTGNAHRNSVGDPMLRSDHPYFKLVRPSLLGLDCENTGCCP